MVGGDCGFVLLMMMCVDSLFDVDGVMFEMVVWLCLFVIVLLIIMFVNMNIVLVEVIVVLILGMSVLFV